MAGTNQIAERLVNFRVYRDGVDYLGLASVTLPSIDAMTDTVSGAGIAGEVETPVLGHFSSTTVTLSFRTIDGDLTFLAAQKAHALDLRGSQQVYDASLGEYKTVPVKIALRAMPKSINLGTFEPGATTDSEAELEVNYLKVDVDGKTRIEIDKYNYICRIGDTDYLEGVRKDLGLA